MRGREGGRETDGWLYRRVFTGGKEGGRSQAVAAAPARENREKRKSTKYFLLLAWVHLVWVSYWSGEGLGYGASRQMAEEVSLKVWGREGGTHGLRWRNLLIVNGRKLRVLPSVIKQLNIVSVNLKWWLKSSFLVREILTKHSRRSVWSSLKSSQIKHRFTCRVLFCKDRFVVSVYEV